MLHTVTFGDGLALLPVTSNEPHVPWSPIESKSALRTTVLVGAVTTAAQLLLKQVIQMLFLFTVKVCLGKLSRTM